MRNRVWAGIVLLCVNGAALAIDSAPPYQGEASLSITGTVEIDATGAVTTYTVDHRRALDREVVALLDRAVPTWRFEPLATDAIVHPAATPMSVFIVARQVSKNKYEMRIKSAHFMDPGAVPGDQISAVAMAPPTYPKAAQKLGVEGTVYLALRIDRAGHVADVMAEQANVTAMKSEEAARRARKMLVDASTAAAKSWTFHPPTSGSLADAPFWTVRIPIQYQFAGEDGSQYGLWQPYVAGPRQPIPWPHAEEINAGSSSPEGLVAGTVDPVGAGPHLLTLLGQE
jgi:TonB family protein